LNEIFPLLASLTPSGTAALRAVVVTLGAVPVLYVTLYAVGFVQLTDTLDAPFARVAMLPGSGVERAETWQEDTTVAETVTVAVRVAAKECSDVKVDARKTKA
jgi:hypothetical protein